MPTDACRKAACAGVRFQNLAVNLGGKTILANVNATAPCGGATVLVGPNGAGKTTLLRCLLGECRHSGSISFCNEHGDNCRRPVIGYVPQTLAVDPQMPLRVSEFLTLGHCKRPLWLGCSRDARKIAQTALELVDAPNLANQRVSALSGGELRRVLLASALSRKPDLLVLDEAEAGVDYRGERLFWELLDKTRHELGFSLIMVSHNLPLAAHYATHVICIKGTVVAQGAPEQTLTGQTLLQLFGVPIHLYPRECGVEGPSCPQCGAYGNLPYLENETGAQLPPKATGICQ